ncbi:hypothetical protein KBY58_03725 [Cyanobium sp. HWJ4-Hawea]|uniref:hypothetical protein n=1 Tax=Cyanobium sp. HWJ4-Hawea TaxID=2823713 RepID=UPI0020CBAE42|nr:hypothetical protein [Cyanobium sp. HWJ4-Hawea]MCP9808540.1 hypothetical protein [Cyanobium sp. HWJ4-Hawea]
MGLPTPGTNKIQVLRAVEDGWQAFCRAPWSFLLFQILSGLIMLPFVAVAAAGGARLAEVRELMVLHPVGAWMALIVGVIGHVIVALWTFVGLTRGAWICLEGRKPSFADFTRWDRPASARLLGSAVLLAILVGVAVAIAALIGTGLGKVNTVLSVIPMIVLTIFLIWLGITQKFLIQTSLLGTSEPTKTIGLGVNMVNPSWWMVLWLAVIEGVINTIGGLFSYGGLLVVVPVLLCISTAAYRQLFGPEDQTGLLS